MPLNLGETSALLDAQILREFAEVLKLYKLESGKQDYDDFDIVRQFIFITANKARNVIEEGREQDEFEDWDLEVKLWDLVESLLKYRYSDKPSQIKTHGFNSDVVYQEKYFRSNPALYELWIIISWIQNNAMEVERPKLTGSKWFNTQLANALNSYDSDAPIRSKKSLDPKDSAQEMKFYKYIFQLILSGNYKEVSIECEATNNWTMKMILAGVNSYLDPMIDKEMTEDIGESTHGIKKKALWRRTVYLLSKNEDLSPYERAIYGFLAGDLSPLGLSSSWDSDLVIYFNHILTSEVEKSLIYEGKIPKEDLIITFPRNEITVQDVLNIVANKRKSESEHPLRVLIASIITNNVPAIVRSSLSFVGSIMLGEDDSNEILNESYALRVVTHLAIFISIIDPYAIAIEERTKLITTYILVLRLHEQYDLIPLYVSFLPEVEARDAYSLFLIDLFDTQERIKQLELSRLYKLPLENILKRTVERVFSMTEDHYQIGGGVTLQTINDVDMKLMRGVEWFVESRMFSDAIHSAVALYRRFLLNGRTKAAQEFSSRNSIQQLLKQYDVENMGVLVEREVSQFERDELLQYGALARSLNAIDDWQNRSKPVSSYAFIDNINRVSTLLKEVISSLFLDLSQTEYEPALIQELRSLYIPFLIIQLHNIYLDSRSQSSSFLKDALELTNIVASESTKFYILFQNCDRLKEYLGMVANCAAIAAGEGL
jgi:nuclear pore complex protein Nup107